jgi:hypothetical protein
MQNSIGMGRFSISLSRTTSLCRSFLSTPAPLHHIPLHFCTTTTPFSDSNEAESAAPSPSPEQTERTFYDRPLENGLDPGIYRVIQSLNQLINLINLLIYFIIEIEFVCRVSVGNIGR